jgi:uncharacterized protein YdeI (YjbR/CyaY-like superfamily)
VPSPVKPRFFASAKAFRVWLERHHATDDALWVGLVKVGKGSGLGYKDALDEALCFGWIDGVRKSIDAESFMIRFARRQAGSIWSEVNIRRADELQGEGRLRDAGLAAFRDRDEAKARSYSYERATCELGAELEAAFRAEREAWAFFTAQPPYYRRVATWYVVSAKREETRRRRLANLVQVSLHGERLAITTSARAKTSA